jgi:hypothetical protein
MSKKKVKKKLLYAALAALAGGGVLYAVYRNREEEAEEGGTKSVPVLPPTGGGTTTGGLAGGSAPPLTDETTTETEDEIIGGGGGGGGGIDPNLRMCLGLNDEAERDVKYVPEGEECPAEFPFDTEEQLEEAQYDAFRCYDVDDNDEIVEQEKELDEVCGEDYPDFPFETRNEALLYLETPSDYEGCTDPEALNFNVDAIFDDGSCEMPVEGCMLEDALNFDPEANVEANDLCEFAPEEVLGCTSETADNFDVEATADDGSCIFSKTCYIFNTDYSIRTEEFEFFSEDATCYDDIPEVLGEVGGVLVFRLGYFDAQEDAEAYLDGFYNGATEIGGGGTGELTDCFFYNPNTGEVASQPTELQQGESCPDASIGPLQFFDSVEDAEQAYFDDVLSLQTQSCISFDSQGTFILDDLPYVSEDTQDIVSCEDLGYFELTEEGEAEAQAEYIVEYGYPEGFADAEEILTSITQCAGWDSGMIPQILALSGAIPDIPNSVAIADVNGFLGYECFDPATGEVIDTEGPDTSPLLTLEQVYSANLCDGFTSAINNEMLTQFGGTLTAKVANELLGSDCFDLVTGENLNVEPVAEGSVMDSTEGFQVANLCYDNAVPESILGSLLSSQFPLSPEEFNGVMEFECLDASGEIINQITIEEEGIVDDETDVIDAYEEGGVGGLLDSLTDFDAGATGDEVLPTENLEEQLSDDQPDLLSEEEEVVDNTGDVIDAFEEEGVGGLLDSLTDFDAGATGDEVLPTENLEEEVIPTGFVADNNEAVALAETCFGASPQAGITLALNTKQYPISPEEFNATIGFACLNSEGDIVGEPPTQEEQVVIDAYEEEGTGGLLDALVDYDVNDQTETLPSDEPVDTPSNDLGDVTDAYQEEGVTGLLDSLIDYDAGTTSEEVIPDEFIADSVEGVDVANLCYNNDIPSDVMYGLATTPYPMSPEAFNEIMGFECLNSLGEVVGEPPTELEEVLPVADGETQAEIDTSPLLTSAQFQTMQDCGQVSSSALQEATGEFGSTLTANRANEIIGYVCFDPVTGENLFYEPIPEEFIEDGNEAVNVAMACYNQEPPLEVIGQLPMASYPISPEDFNTMLGFDCLNSNGDIVGEPPAPIEPESQPNLEEEMLVDDASTPVTPEPVLPAADPDKNIDDAIETGGSVDIQKNFNDFVNSSGRASNVGCTDPLAWNFNEFAVKDDGTCEY